MSRIEIFETPDRLVRGAAVFVEKAAREAIAARGQFFVALSGGRTPLDLYRALIGAPIEWRHTHVFWGDERCVPPTDPGNNFTGAHTALLSHVPLPAENMHRILGEIAPAEAARLYEVEIRRGVPGDPPRFDLVLLGLGTDGHTASLFPGTPALEERQTLVTVSTAPVEPRHRVTFTLPLLNAAREVLFLVSGAEKKDAVARVFQPSRDATPMPAALIRPVDGTVQWFLDRSAAGALKGNLHE